MERWITEVRDYLNQEYTPHLYRRSLKTEDVDSLRALVLKAKKIHAINLSDADQLINKIKEL